MLDGPFNIVLRNRMATSKRVVSGCRGLHSQRHVHFRDKPFDGVKYPHPEQ